MAKEGNVKEYFRHDYHARDHLKFKQLRMDLGLSGMGVYWCLVEMLYEEGGSIDSTHYDSIAFDLRIDKELLLKVIQNYDLFDHDENKFWAKKVLDRLKERAEKSKKAAKSAKKKWKNYHANAERTHSEGNAIIGEDRIEEKRREEKSIKDSDSVVALAAPPKTLEERKKDFAAKLTALLTTYSKELVREFYDYWTESSEKGKKMRYEMEKTFSIPLRMALWKRNNEKFKRNGKPNSLTTAGKLQ